MGCDAALAVAPELTIVDEDSLGLAAAQGDLERAARELCPSLCSGQEGVFYLDFRAIERRYSVEGESAFLGALKLRLSKLKLPLLLGIADTRFAARVAAIHWHQHGLGELLDGQACGHRVRPGRSREFLAPLSISMLPASSAESEFFMRLGIMRLGQLAELHSGALRRRMGSRGLHLQSLARGSEQEPWVSQSEPLRFVVFRDTEHPIGVARELQTLLSLAIDELLASLSAEGLAAARICWLLLLEGGAREGVVNAPQRSTSGSLWRRLLSRAVLSSELSGPVVGIRLEASEVGPQVHVQGQLSGPQSAAMDAVADTLENLRGTLDLASFGRARVCRHTRPESRQEIVPFDSDMSRFQLGHGARDRASVCNNMNVKSSVGPELLRWAFRVACPHEPVEVELSRGRPTLLRWRDCDLPIECSLGPWDISSAWWKRDALCRRYFQLRSPGLMAQVYQSLPSRGWFLSGWWD
tara:strand:+ start:516 stop:1922 length:1407 start_codon:yes stop_codon:yes gene_type:complete